MGKRGKQLGRCDITYDAPSYDKRYDPTIDKCLTCTKAVCRGECEDLKVQPEVEGKWYVRITRKLGNGSTKVSYANGLKKPKGVITMSNFEKIRPVSRLKAEVYAAEAMRTMRGKFKVEIRRSRKDLRR